MLDFGVLRGAIIIVLDMLPPVTGCSPGHSSSENVAKDGGKIGRAGVLSKGGPGLASERTGLPKQGATDGRGELRTLGR